MRKYKSTICNKQNPMDLWYRFLRWELKTTCWALATVLLQRSLRVRGMAGNFGNWYSIIIDAISDPFVGIWSDRVKKDGVDVIHSVWRDNTFALCYYLILGSR